MLCIQYFYAKLTYFFLRLKCFVTFFENYDIFYFDISLIV